MKNSKLSKFLLFSLAPSLLILFSFLYALYLVPTQIVFGFDQARDAYEAFSIYHNHDIKILGPSSDIVGVNHGVLWFYVLALVYFLGNSMPENAVYLLLVALYALVPVIGYFTYKMSKSAVVTWITLVLYVMSPLFLSFTHWLSNPLLALYITPPLLYLLWKYLHKPSALVAGGIGLLYALLIHSDFAYVVFVLLLPIYYFAYSLRFRMWDILSFGAGLLLGLTTFFLTYLKFQTNIVNIVFGFIFKSSSDGFSVGTTVFSFFDNVIRLLSFTYLPLPRLFIFILLVVLFIRFRKVFFTQVDRLLLFLLIWLSGFIFIFVLNHGTLLHSFFYGPFLYPLALLVALYLVRLIPQKRVLFIVVAALVLLQFLEINKWASNSNSPLSVQQGMTINYEREVLDYIYADANKQPFVITTITNPLNINTTWSYVFTFYGKQTYGYVPSFWGDNQEGFLGDLPMQQDLNEPPLRYMIIEPEAGIQKHWVDEYTRREDLLSDVIEEKKIGNFTIQKRLFHPDKGK